MITKFSLDPKSNQPTSRSYRKINGHVTVFANDMYSVAKTLPRRVANVLRSIHVLWCSPTEPGKADLLPFLGIRKSIMMEALR
ncbi:hypothetical protein F4804DRAFT_317401 [Jackrogersella minutella]|nr:hypothetical protein F4804DRAFT_317401 [Jackrogersella minutella]